MDRKIKIIIGIIAVIILFFTIINIFRDNLNKTNLEENSTELETKISDIKYNKDTGEYYIYDENTGEILYTASSEDSLYIYTIDPDYDPRLQADEEISEDNIEDEIE